jgi:hypothetical protein
MSEEEEMKGKLLLLLLSTCFAIIHHGKTVTVSKGRKEEEIHCKKG